MQQLAVAFLGRHGKTETLLTEKLLSRVGGCPLCSKYRNVSWALSPTNGQHRFPRNPRDITSTAFIARLFYHRHGTPPATAKLSVARERNYAFRVYAGVRYPRTASGISLASSPFSTPLPQIFKSTRDLSSKFSSKTSEIWNMLLTVKKTRYINILFNMLRMRVNKLEWIKFLFLWRRKVDLYRILMYRVNTLSYSQFWLVGQIWQKTSHPSFLSLFALFIFYSPPTFRGNAGTAVIYEQPIENSHGV